MKNIVFLDADTIGEGLDLGLISEVGHVTVYKNTKREEINEKIKTADIVMLNKAKLGENELKNTSVKLIVIAATGYDNIDVEYCQNHGIAVCNVAGYSRNNVAQITVSMALSLISKLNEYTSFVKSGEYSESGLANRLSPIYHEISGKTWGIIGYGNIGKKVGEIATALGCNILVNKRTPESGIEITDIDTLCEKSDIISIHTPLNSSTRGIINKDRIKLMKKDVILINVARGACIDEYEVTDAVLSQKIGAFGCDVYSAEPFGIAHPYYKIKDLKNVCLTPHMAWGSLEARKRLLSEMIENIKCFEKGERRNRIDK